MVKSSNQPTQNPLAILNPRAAGLDVGSMLMMVRTPILQGNKNY